MVDEIKDAAAAAEDSTDMIEEIDPGNAVDSVEDLADDAVDNLEEVTNEAAETLSA